MKKSISLNLSLLVLLSLLLPWTPTGHTFAQLRQSDTVKISLEAWPPGELEKYSQLQQEYGRPNPAVESSQGMVAVTTDAFAARAGLEVLQRGGSAADAALATAMAQVALKAECPRFRHGSKKGNEHIQFYGAVYG